MLLAITTQTFLMVTWKIWLKYDVKTFPCTNNKQGGFVSHSFLILKRRNKNTAFAYMQKEIASSKLFSLSI